MGGSISGTETIYSFLKHKNASNSSIELLDEISNNYENKYL